MKIKEIMSIDEATWVLQGLTARKWTTEEFTKTHRRLRLPLYAEAPGGRTIESRVRVDGKLVIAPEPLLRASYATMLQDEIEELAISQSPYIITDMPAWVHGDAHFHTWDFVEKVRAANHRVLAHWEVDRGEWMGESETYFFSRPFAVTADSTLYVPRFAIAKIAEVDLQTRSATQACGLVQPFAETTPIATGAGTGRPANIAPPAILANDAVTGTTVRRDKKNVWDKHALRRLYEESLAPGVTHAKLAAKYGISRQVMSRQIEKAKKAYGPRKATAFDSLGSAFQKR